MPWLRRESGVAMTLVMHRFALVLLLLLTACAPRAQLVMAPGAVTANPVETVFVATTRGYRHPLKFSDQRSAGIAWMRYDIAVPPERQPGEITWPTRAVDPETQFLVTKAQIFDGAGGFRRALTGALASRPADQREAIIYVHGFNNNFADGVLRITQLAHDFGFPGVAVHYSWPSAGHPLAYAYDRDSVLFARDGLEALIAQVRAAGARRVALVGHSVGGQLIMEALRSMAIASPGSVTRAIDGVILISPDLDVDVFRTQAARIGQLPRPFGIFVSQRDRVLQLSARLTGQRNRLGNVGSLDQIADLDVTVIDVSGFSTGTGHFTAGSSPGVIALFSHPHAFEAAFRGDRAGRPGLLPGTVLTVRNATGILLTPTQGR